MTTILGGGIGGLSAAYYLLKSNSKLSKLPISLIESSHRLGGWIKTKQHDNFLFESGPRTIRPTGPAGQNTLKMLEELNLESKIRQIRSTDPAAKNRLIYVNKELCLLPSDFNSAFKKIPPFSKPLISSVFNDIFTGRSKEKLKDESIYKFTERRFGKEVADYLISSMICGICAGDAKEISVKFLMKDIFYLEQKYGGVVKGLLMNKLFSVLGSPNEVHSKLSDRAKLEKWSIYSLDGGLEVFPKTLSNVLQEQNVNFNIGNECKEINFTDDNQVKLRMNNNEEYLTDYVISSISSYRLSYLVKKQHPELSNALRKIPFVNVCVVNFQYEGTGHLKHNGFGYLVPPCENLPILGVIFDSCCFDMNGNTVLTVMMGGRWFNDHFGPDAAEQELLDVARRHVKQILKIKAKPTVSHVHILQKCIPQYVVGHTERVEFIRNYIKEHNLPLGLCGSSYDGVGVNDVIMSSKNLINTL